MRVQQSPLDGAQPREFVLETLREAGVDITQIDGLWFELVDLEGDSVVLPIDDPVMSRMIVHLWRRFGPMHSLLITDLVQRKQAPTH